MPDFTQLLSKPLNDVKRPPLLPSGSYYGVIRSWEPGESSQKKTPFVRFNVAMTHPADDVDTGEMKSRGIDTSVIAKKQMHQDFYITADAEYRLKEFYETLGISDVESRTHQSCLPETLGKAVICDVTERPNREDPTAPGFNEIRNMKGAQ